MKKLTLITLLFICANFIYAQISGIKGSKNTPVVNDQPTPSLQLPSGTLLFEENMDNITSLTGNGWVFSNVDGGGTTDYFQGNTTVFNSYNGANDSYCGQNFNGANNFLIDQWMITPVITSYQTTTFSFWAGAAGGGWDDHFYIYYSPTGSSNIADFVLLLDRTVIPSTAWTQFTQTVTANGPVRFAIRYYETNGGTSGADSNYWGLDNVQLFGNATSVPVSGWFVFGIFLLIGTTIVIKRFYI